MSADAKSVLFEEVEGIIAARHRSYPELCRDLARYVGVPGAGDAWDACGLVGVVLMCAEVLGEEAPPALLATASRLLAKMEFSHAWRTSYSEVLAVCLRQRGER